MRTRSPALALTRLRRFTTAFAVSALALGFAAPAISAPLGLSPGDEIVFLEFDTLRTVSGDGTSFDVLSNMLAGDGRITSVVTSGSGAIAQSGVDFTFDLDFVVENSNISGSPIFAANAVFTSPGGVTPDFTIGQGGADILFGSFISSVLITGNLNVASSGLTNITISGVLGIEGGNAALVAALGGVGAGVDLTATMFDFDPSLATLVASGQIFDSNFIVSMSGLLVPAESAPFVPEPSTALLVGGGLLGLVGIARRARR